MENRVVALAVLENLIHWPLPHRSGYVAPNNVSDEGGEDDNYNPNTVSAGDADDFAREPRQRKLDRYRAVLLLPHLCNKLGSRWVETEVVPYLLRCLEEDDAQLSLVSGLALLGVTLPRRRPLGLSTAASSTSDKSTSAVKTVNGAPSTSPAGGGAGYNNNNSTTATTTTTTNTVNNANTNAYLSLEDVQPVCALLSASNTKEIRAFAAQVVLPHLYFGTGLERDVTLESWDLKFVPLSVLHADMIASNSCGLSGEDGGGSTALSMTAKAEEEDEAATLSFVAAVRRQLVRQRQQEYMRNGPPQRSAKDSISQNILTAAGESDTSLSNDPGSSNASPRKTNSLDVPSTTAMGGRGGKLMRFSPVMPTDEDVRRRCQTLVAEDENMQFMFGGTYDTLTGPWGFSGCRLASLTQGAKALYTPSDDRRSSISSGNGGGNSSSGGRNNSGKRGATTAMSAGGGFRSFRTHVRRVSGGQALRGAPPPSRRPLFDADLELYGASYAVDKGSENSGDVATRGDDLFSVNVRARALVGDLTRWMEALTPSETPISAAETLTSPASRLSTPSSVSPSPLFLPGQRLCLYDYFSHEARREVLRSRWRALLKLLQSFLESPYPGQVAVAVELISGLLHALQLVMVEVEEYLQREPNEGTENGEADAQLWGIGVPSTPLLTTAQLQSFIYHTTRRHIAYFIAAAVTVRKVNVPSLSPLNVAKAVTTWRAPTESLARLLRGALPVAQKSLTDLVLHYHIVVKLNASPSAESNTSKTGNNNNGGDGVCVLLQIGPGACESRAAALSAWDISFAPPAGYSGTCIMPDDTSSFLNTAVAVARERSSSTGTATTSDSAALSLDRTRWLSGTLNAFSTFRLHRVIRHAVLRALPLAVDFLYLSNTLPSLNTSAAAAGTTATTSTASSTTTTTPTIFSLRAVCPMLLQVLVPLGTLPSFLRVLYAAAALPEEVAHSNNTPSKSLHVDPAWTTSPFTSDAALRHLWTAMTAPTSILGAAEDSATAARGQETPSSLDFELLEAALDAVQRLTAEAAVQLSTVLPLLLTSSSSLLSAPAPTLSKQSSTTGTPVSAGTTLQVRTVHAVCAQLFTLVAACVRWVPRYTNWRARWLIAQKLPQLLSTFCFLLAIVAELRARTDTTTRIQSGSSENPFQQVAVMWLQCTLQLLTSVWSCVEAFGVAPLNDLTDDEEVEVRCIAVRCAACVFRCVVEAVLRISAPACAQQTAATARNNSTIVAMSTPLLMPSLTEPLTQLLDATTQCVLVGANDLDARVRCRATEALAVLSRTLSMLVAADDRSSRPSADASSGRASEEAVWSRYLRSNTEVLLKMMSDETPAVQLALVAQLTDLLLLHMRGPSQEETDGTKNNSVSEGRDDVGSRLSNADNSEDGTEDDEGHKQHYSADQIQHEALLQCLRQLAQHELWRLREQYAMLLAHLCGRLLQTAMFQPLKTQGWLPADASSAMKRRRAAATMNGSNGTTSMQAEASSYGHTHPLYQLARTELLTLLVAVMFDKVKAVRDAALDAVEQMCLQLAAANRQSSHFLQQGSSASSSGLVNSNSKANGGTAGTGRAFESIISSSSALQNANNNVYNFNTFVDNVLWPRISAYDKAWETYLSRSALLHIALRLRVDKSSVFIPLLDQLARDPVLNVRLVVAKIILEVLLRSSPDVYAMTAVENRDGEEEGGTTAAEDAAVAAALKPELPSGTVAYCILMNKPVLSPSGSGGRSSSGMDAVLPPLQFTEDERAGVILQILRQLLKDASSDVRDEAAKALKVCF